MRCFCFSFFTGCYVLLFFSSLKFTLTPINPYLFPSFQVILFSFFSWNQPAVMLKDDIANVGSRP